MLKKAPLDFKKWWKKIKSIYQFVNHVKMCDFVFLSSTLTLQNMYWMTFFLTAWHQNHCTNHQKLWVSSCWNDKTLTPSILEQREVPFKFAPWCKHDRRCGLFPPSPLHGYPKWPYWKPEIPVKNLSFWVSTSRFGGVTAPRQDPFFSVSRQCRDTQIPTFFDRFEPYAWRKTACSYFLHTTHGKNCWWRKSCTTWDV